MRTVGCSGRLKGCLARGVCLPRGCLPKGRISAQRGLPGGLVSAQGVTPLWTEFLTHACENITFPQLLLGTVINKI